MIKHLFAVNWRVLEKPSYWLPPMVLTAMLIVALQFSFLLFHVLAEGVTIVVAGMMVATAWQTYDLTHNRFFTVLGYGFAACALIDLIHTIFYKGMLILPVESANAATQLWIAGRYLEAFVLLYAIAALRRLPPPGIVVPFLGTITLMLMWAVWVGLFPDAFVEPTGLTPFKIVSEYIIIGILGVALLVLGYRREELPEIVVAPLGAAIAASMVSEFAFTFYVGVYDLSNIVGHVFKLMAFWFIFIAIVRTTLAEPFIRLREKSEQQRRTASTLRHSEERLRSIVENTQDAIVMVNDKGLVTFWNSSAVGMFGYTESEALGQPVHNLLAPPEDMPLITKRFDEFAKTGEGPVVGRTVPLRARRKDETRIDVELAVSAILENGHWGAIAVVRDVTERTEAERQLRQLQKSEAIESLAAGIAHDFKNMLLPIISLTGMVMDNMPKDSRDHKRLQKVLEAAGRAKDLASRILAFSHDVEPTVARINLSDVVQETADILRSTLLSSISIEQNCEPDIFVNADAEQLQTALLNIASNASDAMEGSTGKIRITLHSHMPTAMDTMRTPAIEADRAYAKLTVEDNGCGMSQDTKSRIFDPYFTTKSVGKGTGFGLPMVHSVVTKHQGAILVDSELGRGTRFSIFLPQSDETPTAADATSDETEAPAP